MKEHNSGQNNLSFLSNVNYSNKLLQRVYLDVIRTGSSGSKLCYIIIKQIPATKVVTNNQQTRSHHHH